MWSNFRELIVFNPEDKLETFASKKSRVMHMMPFPSKQTEKTNRLATLTNWETSLGHIANF
jgi:hypothetical protein